MADPREVLDLSRPDGQDDPLVQPMERLTAEERDVESFTAGASEFSKGARSGFNNLGATFNAFVGNLAESAGLSEFAASRMAEAERFTNFAEAVGPDVKDYRVAADTGRIMDYVMGALGNASASMLPAVAGGGAGALLAGGARGAFAGAFGGSFVPSAGEQALRIKDAPGSTPGGRTANMLAVGTGAALLDSALVGRAAGRLAKPSLRQGGYASEIPKGAAIEGATETAQTALGQAGHTVLDPNRDKSGDRHELIESGIQGSIGGAGFSTASRTAEIAPGMVADGVQGVQKMLTRRQRVAEIADETPDVVDSDDLSKIIGDPAIAGDPEAVGRAIDQLDTDEESSLTKIAKKMGEGAAKFEGWVNDPDKRAEFKAAAKQWVNDQKHAPRVKREWEGVKKSFDEALEAGKAAYAEGKAPKRSDVRTKLDVQLHDWLMPRLPERTLNNLNPTQRMELTQFVKHAAMNQFGQRVEEEGPGEPTWQRPQPSSVKELLTPPTAKESRRATRSVPLPPELLAMLGKDAEGTVMGALEVLEQSRAFDDTRQRSTFADTDAAEPMTDEQVRGMRAAGRKAKVQKAVREAKGKSRLFRDRLTEVVQEEMDDELLDSAKDRTDTIRTFVRVFNENPEMTAGENRWLRASEHREDKVTEDQRVNPQAKRLFALANVIFKDPERAIRRLESMGDSVYLSQEEEDSIGEARTEDGDVTTSDEEAARSDGWAEKRDAETSWAGDARLRTYEGAEEARRGMDALKSDYKALAHEVSFDSVPEERYDPEVDDFVRTGRQTLVAKPRDGSAMTRADWDAVTDTAPGKQAGYQHGTITVKLKGESSPRRVSLKALNRFTVQTTDRAGGGRFQYPHDVVMHGLGTVLGDPRVEWVKEKNTTDKLGAEQWDFPDSTPVGKINGRNYNWGEIRKMSRLSEEELRILRWTDDLLDAARDAESIAAIEGDEDGLYQDKIAMLPWAITKTKALKKLADKAKGTELYDDAKDRYDRMVKATRQVYGEIRRREEEGDAPVSHELGEFDVDQNIADQASQPTTKDREEAAGLRARNVQEETGETLQGAPARKGGAGYQPHEVGQKPEDRAAGPVTDVLGEADAAINAAGRESEAVQQQRSDEELSKFGDAIIGGAGPFQVLMNTAKRGDKMDLFDMRRMLASAEFGSRLSEIERPALKKLATERRDALLRALEAKKSAQTVKATGPITDEEKAEVREYVERVLGKKNAKAVFKNLKHAGEFFEKDGVELLRIANLAMDPMGTARHEAAHALFARLLKHDKAAAQTLLAAAQSPHVVARLRELLKDHPDALKQLSDPEERLAYMYQFWNSGDLKAGPKTEKWFDKVKAFFRKVMSVWTGTFYESENADKAAQIFDLFDRGDLSNRDTVAEVLRDKLVKSAVTRATELMGPAAKAARGLVYTSVSNVKAMNVPAFNEVMDKMWYDATKGGKAEPGFNQAKHPVRNRLLSRLEAAIGAASAETQREAIEALQSNTAPASAEARAVVKGVRELLAETFTYMKGKKVKAVVWNKGKYEEHDIGFVKDYFPRYYDKQAIVERRGEFLAMLRKNGVPEAEAQEVYESVTQSQPRSPAENDYEVGLTYYAPNTQARKLNVPAAELAPFLRKDLGDAMRSYIAFAVRRAEYASRFGNQGQAIKAAEELAVKEQGATLEQVKAFNRAVQALEGSLGHDIDPAAKSTMGAIQTYQHVRLLPLAVFSSLTIDPMGIVVRGGTVSEAFGAFARVVRNLVSEAKDDAYDMAVAVGSISSAIDTHMLQEAYGMQDFGGATQKINSALFRWNGMDSLNRSMRVAATSAGHSFIVRHLTKPGEHSKRYLEELGLDESVKVVDGKLDLTDQRVADAINLWVDGAVLRPNAAIRPAWTSDPHWMLVSSLKQYMYAFQETIIKRVVHEAGHGNMSPAYALMTYVPLIIAADLMRAALTPGSGDDEAWKRMELSDVLLRGIQRAGVTGPLGGYAMDAAGDMGHYNVPFASLAGPTGEQLFNLGKAAAGAPGSDLGREGLRALPGYIFLK